MALRAAAQRSRLQLAQPCYFSQQFAQLRHVVVALEQDWDRAGSFDRPLEERQHGVGDWLAVGVEQHAIFERVVAGDMDFKDALER
jgi:hypothetical protein